MSRSLDRSLYKRKKKIKNRDVSPWDEAIAEARQRIADLKFSIRDFEERKARGEQWRGLENAQD
jgi:hypothetical protein